MDIKKSEWEESYKRKENFIYFPHDECVKFIKRYLDFNNSVGGKCILDFG